ncbi:hypothetical protein BGZ51_000943 [Haplosporangium sp. Z 767]|nr:hypothetical protein BGZ51_000943 [Haplosporangium sp. Z 767]
MSVTRVVESRIIDAPIDVVWKHVRSVDLGFWKAVKRVDIHGGAGEVGSTRKVSFNDGAVQEIKIVELSDLAHFVSFDFIEAQPPVDFMSALHTISLRKVTANNTTFVEWSAEFSSDAQLAVIEDSRYKRLEGLEDLAKAVAKQTTGYIDIMANPSTQPPSNATTTNILFARDFVQSSYTLLELPKSLESYIEDNVDGSQLSFQVRGLEKDTAVLCTPNQTFSLQRAHTSNILLPIAPIRDQRKQDEDMDMDTDMDTDYAYFQEEEDSPYRKQLVLDILDNVLDVIPIAPRLDRLADLLDQGQFEGWAQESKVKEILMSMTVLDMAAEAVDGRALCDTIENEAPERESGIESWMVEHCLSSFSENEQLAHPVSIVSRKDMYIHGRPSSVDDREDLVYLAGECIVEADHAPERNQSHKFIRYFSRNHLPNDPATRFTALFEIKSKWDGQEIRPFLRDLVLDEKKLDILLLKHARSVKQAGGGVIYCSRVIK